MCRVVYDGLTPLRGNVTDADIEKFFIPENFKPVGETREEATGRPGTTILYDEFGIAHITGQTREDLAFGAGWVTARDRGLLVALGRGPARAAVADIPGINAFGLVTSAQEFIPGEPGCARCLRRKTVQSRRIRAHPRVHPLYVRG